MSVPLQTMKLLITTQAIDKNDPILGFFHRWVEEFAKHFEHIHVICLREGEHALPENVTVYSLGKERGENRLKYIWRFYKYFTNIFFRERVDFVFFHMGAIHNIMAAPFFFARRFFGTQFYWWKTHGKLNLLGRAALFFVDVVVTAGSKSFNAQTSKLRVVGHAIDTELFSGKATRPKNGIRLLSVGRIAPIKKLEHAIHACKIFKDSTDKEPSFDIYGPVTDALYKKHLDTQIQVLNLQDSIHFHGAVRQSVLSELYTQYDVLIHPAYEAGFDKVVLEAMATGVVPITSIESYKAILKPFGLYVQGEDIQAYVMVLTRITNMTEEEKEALKNGLRKIVVDCHSVSTLSSRIFGIV